MKNKILLAELYPELAAQWHPTLNKDITFNDFSAGSHKRVWWQDELGHEWETALSNRVKGSGCPYCANQRVLAGFNDLAFCYPIVAAQWHPTLNGELTPEMVTARSTKRVWWLGECGHEWDMVINKRTVRCYNCPYCRGRRRLAINQNDRELDLPLDKKQTIGNVLSNRETAEERSRQGKTIRRKLVVGQTDLASQYPHLVAEWHPTLNGDFSPEMVTRGSEKEVWWQCSKGHEWDMPVYNRTSKRPAGCPYCTGQRVLPGFNDLVTTCPQIASQWHPTKNGDLTPEMVTRGSATKVWWQDELGHEWLDSLASRRKQGCPVCAGKRILIGFNDLSTIHPEVASEWHPTKNGDLSAEMVTAGRSGKKVWWLGKCGHEWQAEVSSRTKGNKGTGCPYCAGNSILVGFNDLAKIHPQLAAQWHPTLNGELTPEMMSAGSRKKVWWQCSKGHEWQAEIIGRARTKRKVYGCPACAARIFVSRGEQEIADYLTQELGLSIEQSNRSLLGGTEIDIYIPEKQIAIEYNGLYWHSTARRKNDHRHLEKYELARAAGVQLLQIWEDEWENKPALIKRLLAHKLGVSKEPLVGARQTLIEEGSLAEARVFLNEYHIQGHTNGSYYLGLRSQETSQLVAVMVLVKRANPAGFTLEIVRYATSCQVPGGFTKLLKHVETTLQPSRLNAFADHCISGGGLYAQNGFTTEKELAPDYHYLVNKQRVPKSEYRLARFKSDPKLLWEPNLTETQLAALNGLHRIYDAGKTRWVKTLG